MNTELLYKYISGNTNDLERRLVSDWIQESDEHLREYMALRKLYDVSIWQPESVIKDVKTHSSRHRFWIGFVKVAVAASVLLVLGLRWFTWDKTDITYQSVYVPAGQRAELKLADGTKVWLNSRSKLTFPTEFNEDYRTVTLEGEGYFEVIGNKEQPFIVETNKFDIKVVGTEFNVCAYNEDEFWETALLKGKIEVLPSGLRTKGIYMEPLMKLTNENGKLIKSRIHSDEYYRWREGLICFTDINLKDLFEKLKLYYDVNFVINNVEVLDNRYSGKFRTSDGIIHVLNVLKLDNHFDYERDEESNVITIN